MKRKPFKPPKGWEPISTVCGWKKPTHWLCAAVMRNNFGKWVAYREGIGEHIGQFDTREEAFRALGVKT
jgi:hypothetical protein